MSAYLRNAWYAAALSPEMSSSEILARTLLDEPVALFRDALAEAVALVDRGPHRFAPLSRGTLANGIIECAERPQPVHYSALPDPEGAVDQRFRIRWYSPSNLLLWVRARNVTQPEATTGETVTAHLLSPETAGSTHYFFLNRRPWARPMARSTTRCARVSPMHFPARTSRSCRRSKPQWLAATSGQCRRSFSPAIPAPSLCGAGSPALSPPNRAPSPMLAPTPLAAAEPAL